MSTLREVNKNNSRQPQGHFKTKEMDVMPWCNLVLINTWLILSLPPRQDMQYSSMIYATASCQSSIYFNDVMLVG
jgi:hypothetical protein